MQIGYRLHLDIVRRRPRWHAGDDNDITMLEKRLQLTADRARIAGNAVLHVQTGRRGNGTEWDKVDAAAGLNDEIGPVTAVLHRVGNAGHALVRQFKVK